MTEPNKQLKNAHLAALEEMQGPSEEEKARRRVLIAEDEARLAKAEGEQ